MAKGRRPKSNLYSGNAVDRYKRRTWQVSSDPELRRLQRQIQERTYDINASEMSARQDVIVELERARDRATTEEARMQLQMALDRYRREHIDQGVGLSDVSGQVRTIEEATDILGRLTKHTSGARDSRLRENYDKALRVQGHDELANWLLGLSDNDFRLAFYANPNASLGFEYSTDADREAQLFDQWKRTVRAIRKRSYKRNIETNLDEYVAEEFYESAYQTYEAQRRSHRTSGKRKKR